MVGRHHWPHGDARHELADEIARACGRDRIDRKSGGAVAQPLLRAPESLGVDGRGQKREGDAQRLQALHEKRNWQHRVDRKRELRLDVFGHALRAGADGPRARDQRPRVADQRFSRVGQLRRLAGAIEQGEPKRRLERLDRLADRRLDPAELSRSGRKASCVGDRDENAHLVKRQRVDHPSPPEMDTSIIWPIATIGTTVDM